MPQRRKKREAYSRALHVELRVSAAGGGVAVAVELVLRVVEWKLLLLTSPCCKCCGERRRGERARTCVGCWRSDSEPADGGMGPTQECTNRPEAPRRSYARATTGSVRSVRTAAWRGAWWLSASADGGGGVVRDGVAADVPVC